MKRLAALILAAVFLAGCSALEWLPRLGENASQADAPGQTVRQETVLPVYLEAGALMPPSLEQYGEERGITLTQVEDPAQAGLSVLAAPPQEPDNWRPLQDQLALDQLLEEETRYLTGETVPYGYQINTDALNELFGGSAPLDDLKASTYAEWKAFVQAAAAWLEEPGETTVTLNGVSYTLAGAKGTALEGVSGVFAIDCKTGYGLEALTPALTASGGDTTAARLTGPLNSSWETFGLEQGYLAQGDTDAAGAKALFEEGKALFYRGRGQDVLAMKCSFDSTDMAPDSGATVEGLATTPAQVPAGWLAVSAQAEEEVARQGMGYLVWLASTQGLPEQATIMTGNQSAQANEALTGFLGGAWTNTQRSQYIQQVLKALA